MTLILILFLGWMNKTITLIILEAFVSVDLVLFVIVVGLVAAALGGGLVGWFVVVSELVFVGCGAELFDST